MALVAIRESGGEGCIIIYRSCLAMGEEAKMKEEKLGRDGKEEK